MRVLTSNEVREATSGVEADLQVVIRRAGYAVAQFCASRFKFGSVCVVCGKGHSGGAGLVAAEALRRVAETVSIIMLAKQRDELNADAAACLNRDLAPIWVSDPLEFENDAVRQALGADLVIDAITGTGFRPPLRGLAAAAVAAINDAPGMVVSVDVPSGVDADSRDPVGESAGNMVFAHGIIALAAPKPAHVFGELTPGPIAVSEIGAQPSLVPNETGLAVITGRDVGIVFARGANDAHEEQIGHVLIVAGSLGRAGAAALAGLGAMSAGAGEVTVACPKSIQGTVAGFSPSLVTHGLPETAAGTIAAAAIGQIDALLRGKDAVVLGPGLSRDAETAAFVRRLVAEIPLPVVLDGDCLNAFDGHRGELKRSGDARPFRVLALHPGEAARLTDLATGDIPMDRIGVARRLAKETGSCVVLKGWRTVVAGLSGETWINMSDNPALAKAGAGDVLAGMIGAALARHSGGRAGAPDFAAERDRPLHRTFLKDLRVAAAVHLHGLAGDIARDALHENTVAATDLIEALAEAFRECERQVEQGLFYLRK